MRSIQMCDFFVTDGDEGLLLMCEEMNVTITLHRKRFLQYMKRGIHMTRQEAYALIAGLTPAEKRLLYELLLSLQQNREPAELPPEKDR